MWEYMFDAPSANVIIFLVDVSAEGQGGTASGATSGLGAGRMAHRGAAHVAWVVTGRRLDCLPQRSAWPL